MNNALQPFLLGTYCLFSTISVALLVYCVNLMHGNNKIYPVLNTYNLKVIYVLF